MTGRIRGVALALRLAGMAALAGGMARGPATTGRAWGLEAAEAFRYLELG